MSAHLQPLNSKPHVKGQTKSKLIRESMGVHVCPPPWEELMGPQRTENQKAEAASKQKPNTPEDPADLTNESFRL